MRSRIQRLTPTFFSHIPKGLVVVVVFAFVGVILLTTSHAATTTASLEAETGTISGNSSTVTDTTASGSSALKFGSAAATRSLNCVPAVNATLTNTVSHLCGYPDTTNTGPLDHCSTVTNVPADATSGSGWVWESAYGDVRVNDAGSVLNCLHVEGSINVYANNVTVQNTVLHAGGETWTVGLYHANNAIIKNNTMYSDTLDGANRLEVGVKDIYGDASGTQVLNNNIYRTSTAIQIANGTVTGNYLHDFGYNNFGIPPRAGG